MKHFSFALLFFLFPVIGLIAQTPYQIRESIDFFNLNKRAHGEAKSWLEISDINGSPYLNDEFIKGTIFTKSKAQFVGIELRYNVYTDQVEFKSDKGQVQVLAAPETIEKIEWNDTKMVYIPYTVSQKIKRGYFIELLGGEKASLLSRPRVFFQEANEPRAYQEAVPAKFVRKSDEIFIRISKKPAQLISGKKDLLGAFPEHQNKVESFIKKNRVRPNKPEELGELVQYYNSL